MAILLYLRDQLGEPNLSPLDVSFFLLWPTALLCYTVRTGVRLEWPLPVVTELLGWSILLVMWMAGTFVFYRRAGRSCMLCASQAPGLVVNFLLREWPQVSPTQSSEQITTIKSSCACVFPSEAKDIAQMDMTKDHVIDVRLIRETQIELLDWTGSKVDYMASGFS